MKALTRWLLAAVALLQLIMMASVWNRVADSTLSAHLRLETSGEFYRLLQTTVAVLVVATIGMMIIERFDIGLYAVGGTMFAVWTFFTGMISELQQITMPVVAVFAILAGIVTTLRKHKKRERENEIARRAQHPAA